MLASIIRNIAVSGAELGVARPPVVQPQPLAIEPTASPARTEAAPVKPAAKPEPTPAKAVPKKVEAKKPAPKKAAPKPPAEPARWWVQVAGGANVDDLPKAWRSLAAKADSLKKRQAWTTPLRFTNRLLTGPFNSGDEAQDFVNSLKGDGVSAFSFQSEEGQKISKLPKE